VEVEPSAIQVTALKQAENISGAELILRACSYSDQAVSAVLHLPRWGRDIQANFGPHEIKTFRIPTDPSLPVRETNLLEE
jgi:alpha-mannosidase